MRQLVHKLEGYHKKTGYDAASKTSLEGVLLRLEQFGDWHAAGENDPIEDLGLFPQGRRDGVGPENDQWGMAVIEGGAEMDEYPKAALLSLLASVLYFDAIVRRREGLSGATFPPMQIFFEEANKVLTGVTGGAAADRDSNSNTVSEVFQTFWRDGRKYQIFLHPIVQTASELPPGIFSSCNNLFAVQTKNPKDRDLVLAQIGRSEKGFVNTEYKRYLARIPRRLAVVKLGYSDHVTDLEPLLVSPLRVPGAEPGDGEIV